jgi:hypothetical protein
MLPATDVEDGRPAPTYQREAADSGRRNRIRSDDVKYMLLIYFNPATWDALTEEEHQAVFSGHDEFMRTIRESGEMIGTEALANPSQSTVVRVRDGVPAVTDGPFLEAKEFFAGYYLVDCESRERAEQLAAMIPDAKFAAMEVRPIMTFDRPEM